MTALLAHASRRFYLRHPWQLILAIAGISLGVAVYVGVNLANDSARRAFELSSSIVRGATTHRLLPLGREMDERAYAELARLPGVTAAPVLESPISLDGRAPETLTLLGIDPLSEGGLRPFSTFLPGSADGVSRLITEPGTVLVSELLLESLGLAVGDRLAIETGAGSRIVAIAGTIAADEAAPEAEMPMIADISTAQELTGNIGVLSRIDLAIDDSSAAEFARTLPPGTVLVPATSQDEAFAELTRAFQTNIQALGLLALVVGMFLIYATMSFAIVQRRSALGVMRAIGVTRAQLVTAVLGEAAVIGALGTVIGIVLGQELAQILVGMVLRTIGDFYFSSAVAALPASRSVLAQSALLGFGASTVAALGPLREVAATAPAAVMQRASLEHRATARRGLSSAAAIALLVCAMVLLTIDRQSLALGFVAIFALLCAGALATPTMTVCIMKGLESAAARHLGLPALLAMRNVAANSSRTAVASAALAVAVATVIGIGIMIASFRSSLGQWLETTLTADIYMNMAQTRPTSRALEPVLAAIAAQAGVEHLSPSRFVELPTPDGPIGLRALSPGPRGFGLDIVDGDEDTAVAALQSGQGVVISEPLAFRLQLERGDTLRLPTDGGEREFEIVGIFRDYNASAGSVTMSLPLYQRLWNDTSISGVGIYLARSADITTFADGLRNRVNLPAGTRIRTTGAITELSMRIFDRTFEITEVLRILAAVIAFCGVLSTILALELERVREFAVLRSLGFSPSKLGALIVTEAGLLGCAAGLAAVPIGLALAAMLVFVINQRSFGWTMDLSLTPGPFVVGVLLAAGASLLAGLMPSLRTRRSDLAADLRDE
jgi:putative ABC transport system permease protein